MELPANLTPLTSSLLATVLQETGLPDGVLNIVNTTSAGDVTGPLIEDPRLRKLSFTGSTPVDRSLVSAASQNVLHTSVELANNTEYGLVAYVLTRDSNRGLRMGERLDVGMLGLDAGTVSSAAAPFGGVKQSGLGREGGSEGIEEYLYTQYTGIADPYAS